MRASGSIRPAASVPEHWRQQLRLSEKSTHTERTAFAFGIGAASPASRGPLPVFLTLAVLVAALAFLVAPAAGQSVAHIKPVFERSKVNVLEGGSVRVGIKLNANPGRDVTVRIARRSADNSVTLASGRYTISRATWNIFRLGGLVQEITLNGPAKRGGFQYRPTNYLYFSVDGSELETRLVAEVIDTDERRRPAGVVVSKPRLMINNFPPGLGSASGTYAVKLASRPHQNVEVKPFAASGTPLSFSPWDGLEFTPDNWNQWQEFEVQFTAQDVDREHDSYEVCHWTTSSSITGGDPHYHDQGLESYLIAITGGRMEGGLGCFTAVEIDQDAPGIVMDPNPWDFGWRFDLAEGMSRDFDVRPRTQPSADVTITPVRRPPSDLHPGDATITANSLTFTNMNWHTPQTLTFTAAEDDDDWAYTRAQRFHLTTTSSDPDYANKRFITIDVRAVENDESPGVKVADQNQEWISDPTREERGYVSLPVGQMSTIYMRLTQRPLSRPVTIHPKIGYYYNAENGSNRITILDDSLTFTTSNWNTYQPVRVRANAGSLGVSGEIWIFFSSADDRYDAHAYNTMRFRVVAASVSVGGNSGTEAPEPEAPQPVAGQVGEPEPEAGGQGGGSEPDPEVGGQGGVGEPDLVEPVEPPDPEIAAPGEERDPDAVGVQVRAGGDFLKITDGETATYQIVLEGPPTHNVYVAVEKDFGPPLLSASPAALIFTPDNWDQPKRVVVSSPQDDDSMGGNGLFFHTVSSDDEYYDGLATSDVRVRSTDYDNFGGGASFRAWLARLPAQHDGRDFTVRLGFDAVPDNLTASEIRNYVVAMQGGVITGVQQVNNKAFNLTVRPDGNADVVMTIQPTGSCSAVTDVCTRRSGTLLPLQIGYRAWIPGPLN